jgi:hypothetical protein
MDLMTHVTLAMSEVVDDDETSGVAKGLSLNSLHWQPLQFRSKSRYNDPNSLLQFLLYRISWDSLFLFHGVAQQTRASQ